jgi:hypothetical protein
MQQDSGLLRSIWVQVRPVALYVHTHVCLLQRVSTSKGAAYRRSGPARQSGHPSRWGDARGCGARAAFRQQRRAAVLVVASASGARPGSSAAHAQTSWYGVPARTVQRI